ncbi:MAG: glycogen synthase GlgA [Ethanoligenens sp.]
MKILYAASEAVPFAKTGGLADVAGSLPKALVEEGIDCRVVLPLYENIPESLRESMHFLCHFQVPVSWRSKYCGVFESKIGNVTYYLIDDEYYFKRPGYYGHYDDAERFAFFARAVVEMLPHIGFQPDILHANDWQTALAPVYLHAYYQKDPFYSGMKTVFTVHNVEYQGKYGYEIYNDILGLPQNFFHIVDYDDCVNFMKGAIVCSDAVTTVSPSYSYELRYPYFSFGLDRIFTMAGYKMHGILNGINNAANDPYTDKCLFANYSKTNPVKKAVNKRGLQQMLGLPLDENAMVIGYIGRLVRAKGIELIRFVLEELLTHSVQLVVLGTGDWQYENFFAEMQHRFPGKLAARIAFSDDLARKIYSGADALLMPSRSEPCGLSQLIALRYGTIPIVHQIGGLADSITDAGDNTGNGFTFKQFNAHDMLGAISRAEGVFANKSMWKALVSRAMSCDFSWKHSVKDYKGMYEEVLR